MYSTHQHYTTTINTVLYVYSTHQQYTTTLNTVLYVYSTHQHYTTTVNTVLYVYSTHQHYTTTVNTVLYVYSNLTFEDYSTLSNTIDRTYRHMYSNVTVTMYSKVFNFKSRRLRVGIVPVPCILFLHDFQVLISDNEDHGNVNQQTYCIIRDHLIEIIIYCTATRTNFVLLTNSL